MKTKDLAFFSRIVEEVVVEQKLRPKRLAEFIGQERVKINLKLALESAKMRGEALDHVLFAGPPGLGKTTLSNIVANELGVKFQATTGPVLRSKKELIPILISLSARQVLFVDEVHRLTPMLEEILYTALEDSKVDVILGETTHQVDIDPFTFIGATTRMGKLTAPLRSRFGILLHLEYYSQAELTIIINRSAKILGIEIEEDGALEIASRARGTPRIANRLLRRVLDYALVNGAYVITKPIAQAAFELLEIDKHGFDNMDRKLLLAIIEKYQGGPVGLHTLAAVLSEEPDVVEEVYEPYLMQLGFLARTPQGRIATKLAYDHFGIR